MVPGYDLHTHTTLSDGTTTPERNVELAIAVGLDGIAVTDHDTAAGWERSRKAAEGSGLEIIPGAEMSAEVDGWSVHVLGYWFDPQDPDLTGEMDRIFNERERRAEEIVEKFHGLDIPVSMERVRELAGDAPIGRPHLATAVIETGAAETTQDVFDRWLHDGGPAYVEKYAVTPERCVELIVRAGGVAVLAHPVLYGPSADKGRAGVGLDEEAVKNMVAVGLSGIEARHPDHSEEDAARYADMARRLDLVMTAGSDFHGERKDIELGEVTSDVDVVIALRERLPR